MSLADCTLSVTSPAAMIAVTVAVLQHNSYATLFVYCCCTSLEPAMYFKHLLITYVIVS